MLRRLSTYQAGFTLTELMVGSSIGLLVFSGTLTLHGSIVGATFTSQTSAHLNYELRNTMDLIIRDLRRAGYWSAEPTAEILTKNPFQFGENDLAIGNAAGEPANSCVTFSYDRDHDQLIGIGAKGNTTDLFDRDNVEQYGFRLHNGAIESRTSGASFSCNSGRWQDVTSPTTVITKLQFVLGRNTTNLSRPNENCELGDLCQHHRKVEINLIGQSTVDDSIHTQLTNTVQIRNDRLATITN